MSIPEVLIALVIAIITVVIVLSGVGTYVRMRVSLFKQEFDVSCEQNLTNVMLALLNGSTPSVLERDLSNFDLSIEEASVNGIGVYRVSMECGRGFLEGTVVRW